MLVFVITRASARGTFSTVATNPHNCRVGVHKDVWA